MWGHYRADIDGHPGADTVARMRIRRWLETLGWPLGAREDLICAAGEAVGNAAEHAYPPGYAGPVMLRVDLLAGPDGRHHLSVSVTDSGRWRDPAATRPVRRDGGGFARIRERTAQLWVKGSARGTRVRMISKPAWLPRSAMPAWT